MKRHVVDLAVLLAACTIAALAAAGAEPAWRGAVLRLYVFALGALAMLALVVALGDAVPRRRRSPLDAALAATAPGDTPLQQLERAQREVTLACTAAFDLHRTLLPQLREVAEARLESAGLTPGPATLGRWWELLRPDREPPPDRFAPGIRLDELRELVRDLERIG